MQLKLMHSLFFYIFVIAGFLSSANSRPSDTPSSQDPSEYYGHLSSETIRKLQKCDMDMDVMELCMRCAKVTKSQIVYPLCCDDEDDVQGWCQRYIFFGQSS